MLYLLKKLTRQKKETHGIDDAEKIIGYTTPAIYSADASLFVLRAGVAFIEQGLPDFLYLSLTDYMQHTYAPEAEESLSFYEAMDKEIGRLVELGAIVGATADHGMNAKVKKFVRHPSNIQWQQTSAHRVHGPFHNVLHE